MSNFRDNRSTMPLLAHCPLSREILGAHAATVGEGVRETRTAYFSEGIFYIEKRRGGLRARQSYTKEYDFAKDWHELSGGRRAKRS